MFGVIAARTSKLKLPMSERAGSTPYVTPFGLVRETSLSRDVVEAAARRLKRAGLLETLVDDERGYESWPRRRRVGMRRALGDPGRLVCRVWSISAFTTVPVGSRQVGAGSAGIQGRPVSASRNAVILSMPC